MKGALRSANADLKVVDEAHLPLVVGQEGVVDVDSSHFLATFIQEVFMPVRNYNSTRSTCDS
jgi:hypothetical protein